MEFVKNLLVIYKMELQFHLTFGNSFEFKGGMARQKYCIYFFWICSYDMQSDLIT